MASCNVAQSFSPFRASATAKRGRVVAVSAAQNRSFDRRCSSEAFLRKKHPKFFPAGPKDSLGHAACHCVTILQYKRMNKIDHTLHPSRSPPRLNLHALIGLPMALHPLRFPNNLTAEQARMRTVQERTASTAGACSGGSWCQVCICRGWSGESGGRTDRQGCRICQRRCV